MDVKISPFYGQGSFRVAGLCENDCQTWFLSG